MKKRLLNIIGILLIATTSLAQQIEIKASLDSTYMLIGAQMNVHLEVVKSEGQIIQFPMILDTLARSVEVLETSAIDSTITQNNRIQLFQTIVFDALKTILCPCKRLRA